MAKTRKISTALLIVICCFAIGYGIGLLIGNATRPKDGEHKITIIETSDIHAAYFDSLYVGDKARKTSLANVSSYLKELRAQGLDPVTIDNGDNLQGDNAAYYFNFVNVQDKHIVARMFDYMDYDAVVVGNHDIETGHPVYDKMKETLGIPYLAANAVYSDGKNKGKPYFTPYTIIKRDRIKIAVIGMTNANIKSWLSEDIWAGLDFLQISSVAQDVVDEVIAKEKPHLVILSVHSGTGNRESEAVADIENEARYLAKTLKGVDIVLSGHDHTPFASVEEGSKGEVAFLNPGSRASVVGRCDVVLEMKSGKIVSKKFAAEVVPMDTVRPDKQFIAEFRPAFEEVRSFANREIGHITKPISFEDALDGPSAYMSLIHSVQLDATGADVSISAPLSTRGFIPEGKITFQDLSQIYVYENKLFVIQMTGRQLKDYLEFSYDTWINRTAPSFNFDSAQGIDYEVSRSAAKGSRVKIFGMSDGTPFDENKVYKVAMTSYRASGGGNLLRDGAGINPDEIEVLAKYKDIRDLIGDYISTRGEITPEVVANWKFVK